MAEPRTIKLWLDDLRTPPDDEWTWVKTVPEAIALFETCEVANASLDNDLGTDDAGKPLPEGRHLILWMAEHNRWPTRSIAVHSANSVASNYMVGVIERYGPFTRDGRTTTFDHI